MNKVFDRGALDILTTGVDGETIKVSWHMTNTTIGNDTIDPNTSTNASFTAPDELGAQANYSAGGYTLANTLVRSDAPNLRSEYDADDLSNALTADPSGRLVAGFLLYRDVGGVWADGIPIAWMDQADAAGSSFPFAPNAGTIGVNWHTQGILYAQVNAAQGQTAMSITRHRITWNFASPVQYGTFVNGDYWVVGPVDITSIVPGPITSGGLAAGGSMVDPVPPVYNGKQGYTEFTPGVTDFYSAALNAALSLPINMNAGQAIVSTEFDPDSNRRGVVKSASVLTVVSAPPAAGSFRPSPYDRLNRNVQHNESDLDYSLLGKLDPTCGGAWTGGIPTFTAAKACVERFWLMHISGWFGSAIYPTWHMGGTLIHYVPGGGTATEPHPDGNWIDFFNGENGTHDDSQYGAFVASITAGVGLLLNCDYTDAEKRETLIAYLQGGIDIAPCLLNDSSFWFADGGWGSGRRWPIIFADIMLGWNLYRTTPGTIRCGEADQTFYIDQATVDMGLSGAGLNHPANIDPYFLTSNWFVQANVQTPPIPEWQLRSTGDPSIPPPISRTPQLISLGSDNAGNAEAYKFCCSSGVWWGAALSALAVTGGRVAWDDEKFFGWLDRAFQFGMGFGYESDWIRQMWTTHRPGLGGVYVAPAALPNTLLPNSNPPSW